MLLFPHISINICYLRMNLHYKKIKTIKLLKKTRNDANNAEGHWCPNLVKRIPKSIRWELNSLQ